MNILELLRERFRPVLEKLTPNVDKYLAMIKPSKQPGVDYQCNFVIPLTKELNMNQQTITIQRLSDKIADLEAELEEYKDSAFMLQALDEAGVDHWVGHSEAMKIYKELVK